MILTQRITKALASNWPILVLLALSPFIVWPLFMSGYFSHQDSLQVMRIFEMRRCFTDTQIPCRWAPDMGDGYGYPLFNYYGVLPYYIGAVLSYVLGFIGAAKSIFFIPLVFGGVSMYSLAKELSNKYGGFVAGVLYMFAPYRALDSYVRGDITESFAIAIIPLVFYFLLRLVKKRSYLNFLGLSLSLALFLLCHNIMNLFYVPLILVWAVFCLATFGFKNALFVIISLAAGFGMAAFFLLPAFFETSLVQADTLKSGVYDFHGHFVSLYQLFLSRFWGYGLSGPSDNLSFQIGWPHWWLVGLVVVFLPKLKSSAHKGLRVTLLFLVVFLFSIFMTHNRSTPIWEAIPILQFAQFPWRFLSVAIFSTSIIGGLSILIVPHKWQIYAALVIAVLAVALNFQFFRPQTFYLNLTDQQELSGSLWQISQKGSITDYLPKTAKVPLGIAPQTPVTLSGQTGIMGFQKGSDTFSFQANVSQPSIVEVPVFDFPVWQVMVNTEAYPKFTDQQGRITLDLNPGRYFVQGIFTNTPIRESADIVSLISALLLIFLPLLFKYGKARDK